MFRRISGQPYRLIIPLFVSLIFQRLLTWSSVWVVIPLWFCYGRSFPVWGPEPRSRHTVIPRNVSLQSWARDANVNDMVSTFFSAFFLSPTGVSWNGAVTGISEECLRGAWRGTSAFGSFPKMMMTRLSSLAPGHSGLPQALNLGIEVVNTTQHLRAGRDCGRLAAEALVLPALSRHAGGPAVPPAVCQHMGACLGGSGGGASLTGGRTWRNWGHSPLPWRGSRTSRPWCSDCTSSSDRLSNKPWQPKAKSVHRWVTLGLRNGVRIWAL